MYFFKNWVLTFSFAFCSLSGIRTSFKTSIKLSSGLLLGWFLMWLFITNAAYINNIYKIWIFIFVNLIFNDAQNIKSRQNRISKFNIFIKPQLGIIPAMDWISDGNDRTPGLKSQTRTFNVATIPAFEMLMLCCSIASWILVLSLSFILSNSSIRQMPWSAITNAPPSRVHSFVWKSRCTEAVSPTAEAPFPVVYTQRGNVFSTYFRNWDLAVPGSPRIRTFMSPRILCFPEK